MLFRNRRPTEGTVAGTRCAAPGGCPALRPVALAAGWGSAGRGERGAAGGRGAWGLAGREGAGRPPPCQGVSGRWKRALPRSRAHWPLVGGQACSWGILDPPRPVPCVPSTSAPGFWSSPGFISSCQFLIQSATQLRPESHGEQEQGHAAHIPRGWTALFLLALYFSPGLFSWPPGP